MTLEPIRIDVEQRAVPSAQQVEGRTCVGEQVTQEVAAGRPLALVECPILRLGSGQLLKPQQIHHHMGEGIRVMIPRTPSDAESEAIDYGVVSETLTPDEAEAFAHGLLNLVATIRVEQRTPAVDSKEQAF